MTKLCVPCAAKIGETISIKKVGGRSKKITCEICKRRRFGTEYEIGRKKE